MKNKNNEKKEEYDNPPINIKFDKTFFRNITIWLVTFIAALTSISFMFNMATYWLTYEVETEFDISCDIGELNLTDIQEGNLPMIKESGCRVYAKTKIPLLVMWGMNFEEKPEPNNYYFEFLEMKQKYENLKVCHALGSPSLLGAEC